MATPVKRPPYTDTELLIAVLAMLTASQLQDYLIVPGNNTELPTKIAYAVLERYGQPVCHEASGKLEYPKLSHKNIKVILAAQHHWPKLLSNVFRRLLPPPDSLQGGHVPREYFMENVSDITILGVLRPLQENGHTEPEPPDHFRYLLALLICQTRRQGKVFEAASRLMTEWKVETKF